MNSPSVHASFWLSSVEGMSWKGHQGSDDPLEAGEKSIESTKAAGAKTPGGSGNKIQPQLGSRMGFVVPAPALEMNGFLIFLDCLLETQIQETKTGNVAEGHSPC